MTQATRGANILEISSLARRKNWRIEPSIGGSDHSSNDFILSGLVRNSQSWGLTIGRWIICCFSQGVMWDWLEWFLGRFYHITPVLSDLHWLPVPPAYFLQDLFAYVQVLERVGPCLSFWSLCWHRGCCASFWFEICSSRWSCCAGTQDRVGFKVFCCGWSEMLEQIADWTQRFFGWSWDFRETLENTLVQSWFFWLGTHFWVCITFCRVRYNVRLIIILIIIRFRERAGC